jgi:sugar phosphate isomerase/epimerase
VTPQIAVQLYSLRERAAAGFGQVLADVADIGYPNVELSGLYDLSPLQLRQRATDLGLTICSAHIQLPDGDAGKMRLEELAILGVPTAYCSLRAEHYTTPDLIARAAERLNQGSSFAAEHGIRLGYHNHWWEFDRTDSGCTGYDLLISALDPALALQIDLYWAAVARMNVPSLLSRLGDRVESVHVKDGPLIIDAPMTAVGEGSVDIPAALAATAAPWHIVELDHYDGEPLEALERSYVYLTDRGLSCGRTTSAKPS